MRKNIEQIVNKYGGHIYDYDEDGILLVDKTGKKIKHLNVIKVDVDDTNLTSIVDFFVQSSDTPDLYTNDRENLPVYVFIDIKCVDLENDEMLESLLNHVKWLMNDNSVYLRFHFDIPSKNWCETFSHFFTSGQSIFKDKWPVFHLCGQFGNVSKADKEFLFSHGFRLFYEHTFIPGGIPFSEKDRECISDLSEFGFRIPFLWYVSHENVDMIEEIIEEAMEINYNYWYRTLFFHRIFLRLFLKNIFIFLFVFIISILTTMKY